MKNIHFDNTSAKKYYMPILFVVLILFVLYFVFEGGEYNKFFYLFVNLFGLILLIRMFWYKAHVQYNTSRILMKINSSSHVSLKYDDITHIEYAEEKLIIKEKAKTHTIDVEDVNPKDVQQLINLMVKHSEAHYEDSTNRGR